MSEHKMHGHSTTLQGHPGNNVVSSSGVVETFEGWFSLHTVYGINYQKWQTFTAEEKDRALDEFKAFIAALEERYQADQSGYAIYNVTGQKGDLMFWFLEPTLEDLNKVETALKKLAIFSVFEKGDSFVSVIEASNYRNLDREDPRIVSKLYPKIPRKQYMCFYPMKKKREEHNNWYMTSRDERARLMRSHGAIGRTYEPELAEFTTGACGLDDWEWGVTLMCDDIIKFKKIVYEMRFDEVSARFGIFGSFTVGSIVTDDVLATMFD